MNKQNSQSLDIYFEDLKVLGRDVMKPCEELALLDGWETKNTPERNKIRQKLIVKNLRFAASVAIKFTGRGLPFDDLVGLANMGMVEAARRFDPALGYRFITFAVWWIRRFIGDALKVAGDAVQVPMNVKNDETTMKRISGEFYQENERLPSPEELRMCFGNKTDVALQKAYEASQPYFSLDAPIRDEGTNERTFLDIQASDLPNPEQILISNDPKKILPLIWAVMTEREKEIIQRHYGLGQDKPESFSDIGRNDGLTRERIRQIHASALRKIRNKPSLMRSVKEAMQES